MKLRVIIPDFHGAHIDWPAAKAFLSDLKAIDPDEVVYLGDGLDCGGTFSTHQRSYTNEMAESYEEDKLQANLFLDSVQEAAPRAISHFLEGNHEQHVERWASRTFQSHRDAVAYLEREGPAAALRLKDRGIAYYRRSEFYQGLSIPGCIKLGKCFFVHGISHSKFATAVHLERFGACVVHGHTHRSQAHVQRTVTSGGHGAWCPGTLAKLQPLYKHTAPSDWAHGYAVQEVLESGLFEHSNIPIFGDRTIASIRRGEHPEIVNTVREELPYEVSPDKQAKMVEQRAAARRKTDSVAAKKLIKQHEKLDAVIAQSRNKTSRITKADCVKALRKYKTQLAAANALGMSTSALRRRLGIV